MANKKTQKDFFNEIIEVVRESGRDDLVEFCEGRISVLDKKSANRNKKVNEENENLKAIIVEVLGTMENGGTATEIMKANDTLSELSNQKVSAMLRQLKDDNKVIKTTEGRKSIFTLA